jgi:hypothetical protein
MAQRPSAATSLPTTAGVALDLEKFENVHQIAGIQTARLSPGTAGETHVAMVNTGSGLRFTVALDRGGDIVDAFYNRSSLTYLTAHGLRPPSHAHHRDMEWLVGFPGGLMTTCGPQFVGRPRIEDGVDVSLHGHHSNTPATVEMLINPDPQRGRNEMLLSMVVRDSRMFGPVVEVRRTIQCIIGRPQIHLYDQVTNRSDTRCPHNWLYHVNLGYPLLDAGSRFIYCGKSSWWHADGTADRPPTDAALNRMKRVPNGLAEHAGTGERGLIVQVKPDREGVCHVGLINKKLSLGFELEYPAAQLPRIANWQHYGPRGSYVTGIEPFSGSLMGKDNDDFKGAEQYLEPGQTRRYQMTIRIHDQKRDLDRFARHDGPVTSA